MDKSRIKNVNLFNKKLGRNEVGDTTNIITPYNSSLANSRKFPPAIKQWVNSVYSYNKNFIKTLPTVDNIVNKLIKSYFSINPLENNRFGKKSRLLIKRFRKLSLNKIFMSKSEIKHFNDKVFITVYLFNKKKLSLLSRLQSLYKNIVGKYKKVRKYSYETKKRVIISEKKNIFLMLNILKKKAFKKVKRTINLYRFSKKSKLMSKTRNKIKEKNIRILFNKNKKIVKPFYTILLEDQIINKLITKLAILEELDKNDEPDNFISKIEKKQNNNNKVSSKYNNRINELVNKYSVSTKTDFNKNIINYQTLSLITKKSIEKLLIENKELTYININNPYELSKYLNYFNKSNNLSIKQLIYLYKIIEVYVKIIKNYYNVVNKYRLYNKLSLLDLSNENPIESTKLYTNYGENLFSTPKDKSKLNKKIISDENFSLIEKLKMVYTSVNLYKKYDKTKIITWTSLKEGKINTLGRNHFIATSKNNSLKNLYNTYELLHKYRPLVSILRLLKYSSKKKPNKSNLIDLVGNYYFMNKPSDKNLPLFSTEWITSRKPRELDYKYIENKFKSIHQTIISKNIYNTNSLLNYYIKFYNNSFNNEYVYKFVKFAKKSWLEKLMPKYVEAYTPKSVKIGKARRFKRDLIKNFKYTNSSLSLYKNIKNKVNRVNVDNYAHLMRDYNVKKFSTFLKIYITNNLTPEQLNARKANIDLKNFLDSFLNNLIKNYELELITNHFSKRMLYAYYIKYICFNNTIYKNWFLNSLKNIISKIYNKKVIFNFVALKYIYLNSDILTNAIVLKLRRNKKIKVKNLLIKTSLLMPNSKVDENFDLPHNPYYKFINNHFNKKLFLHNELFFDLNKKDKTYNNTDITSLNIKSDFKKEKNFTIKSLNLQQSNTINFIKYKSVFGAKFKTSGRLTRRSTACRALSKYGIYGILKNTKLLNKNVSTVKLNNIRLSTTQFTKISSKTRNGSFGFKGWINNN